MGIELTTFSFKGKHLTIEPPQIMGSFQIHALPILSKRTLTLTFYLSELELIHGQTH